MNVGELNCDTETGELDLGGMPGSDPNGRWCMCDLSDLWSDIDYRGSDVIIPGQAAAIDNPRRFTPTRYLLPIVFTGWVNSTGDYVGQAGSVRRCYQALQVWRTVFAPGAGQVDAVAVTFTDPDGVEFTSLGHVSDLRKREFDGGIWEGNVELTITQPWT